MPLKRITLRHLSGELLKLANLEKGFGYTVRQFVAREYLYQDRSRMMKPFLLLALVATVATFIPLRLLPLGAPVWQSLKAEGIGSRLPLAVQEALHLVTIGMQKYFNIAFMLSLPGQSVGTFLLFRKTGYNLAEHLVINTYLFAVQTLIYILALPFITIDSQWPGLLLLVLMYGYWLFALRQIFRPAWWPLLWKSATLALIAQAFTNLIVLLALGIYWIYQYFAA